ncbi:HNH endonuclease [Bacillus toyonensis]
MPIMRACSKCRKKYEYGKKCPCVNKHKKKALAIKGKDDDFYTKKPWRNLREQIILRDGAYCQRCFHISEEYNFDNLEVHHIVARSVNEELQYEPNNLVTVCKKCNLELGTNGVDWDHKIQELQELCL